MPHPDDLSRAEREARSAVTRLNDFLASHLAVIFGSVWIVWVFFVWPLIAVHLSSRIQSQTSYYAQSWIQLYALPLFVYIGNKLQRTSDAQSDAQHQALTHIATQVDKLAGREPDGD